MFSFFLKSVVFDFICPAALLFPGSVQKHGTALALRSLSELLKTELLFKTRKKNPNPETLSKSTGLFSEMVKFSITPHQIKDYLNNIRNYYVF